MWVSVPSLLICCVFTALLKNEGTSESKLQLQEEIKRLTAVIEIYESTKHRHSDDLPLGQYLCPYSLCPQPGSCTFPWDIPMRNHSRATRATRLADREKAELENMVGTQAAVATMEWVGTRNDDVIKYLNIPYCTATAGCLKEQNKNKNKTTQCIV